MRKKLIIIPLLLLAQVAYADTNFLVTESAPVNPGDTTYVYVPVKNPGLTFLEDVSVKLVPKDKASAGAVTLLNDVDLLGTINQQGEERTAKFRIHVNPDAVEGDYFFYIYITSLGKYSDVPTTTKLEDRILTIKGIPTIVLLNSTIGIVEPMSVNRETLKLKNQGTGTVENAVAEISLASGEAKSAFSILGGGTRFSLGNLKAGEEVEIVFDLAVDIAASPGVYNIPVKITGQNNYSSSDFVGLVVAGTTDFEISYQETMGSFSLNVANVGVNPASAVTVSLLHQGNFNIVGSSSAVLGSLNPGDYTSAIFQIMKKPGAEDVLDVVIQYTDTSGMRHTITKSLAVELSSGGAQSGAVRGNTLYTTWLPAIAIIVLLLVAYLHGRKISAYFRKQKGSK